MLVAPLFLKLCFRKPTLWKFFCAVTHVDATKYTECEHLFRRELWLELCVELLPCRCSEFVPIILLHRIVYENFLGHTLGIEIRDGELEHGREGDPKKIRDVYERDPAHMWANGEHRPDECAEHEQDVERGEEVVLQGELKPRE